MYYPKHACSFTGLTAIVILQIFRFAYCLPTDDNKLDEMSRSCHEFLDAAKLYDPTLLHKPKFHLLLHLPENMKEFGPTAAFNAER